MEAADYLPGRLRFGWYRPMPQGAFDIHIVDRVLDEENWTEFCAMTRVVEWLRPFMIDFLALQSDFDSAFAVEDEVGAILTGVLAQSMISIPVGVEANARAQQLVGNFLGAASAFRDRAATRLSREFGRDSPESRALKSETSRMFDASFAYRSMYALRNYAQHHEVPISFVPINAARSADGTMTCQIALHLDPAALITSGITNANLRAELAKIDGKLLMLRDLLAEFMTAHRSIMATILDIYETGLGQMAHYAAALHRILEIPADVVPVVWEGCDPAEGPQSQERCFMCGFDEMSRAFELRFELKAKLAGAVFHNSPERAIV